MKMKKIIPVFLAILTGSVFALLLFNSKNVLATKPKDDANAIAIQIGVFKKKENAISMSKNYGGSVIEDNGVYRVYYSVLSMNENINYITNYLDKKGINYYLKKINLREDITKELEKYEKLMADTSENSKMNVNNEILKYYMEVI